MLVQVFLQIAICLPVNFKQNTKFDITCVSLARETERRAHINKILTKANCKYKIMDAVYGNFILNGRQNISEYSKDLSVAAYAERHMGAQNKFRGAIGLKLTNYIMMRELERSKSAKPLLILEDDADIEADFVTTVENTLSKMKKEWDIILLTPSFNRDYDRPYDEETGLIGMLFLTGTYGFLINGHVAAKKLADFLEICPVDQPIDNYYGMLCERMDLIGYAYDRHLITHLGNVFQSSIETSWVVYPEQLNNSLYEMTK